MRLNALRKEYKPESGPFMWANPDVFANETLSSSRQFLIEQRVRGF